MHDFLIAGLGLAGAHLARFLHRENKSFLVADPGEASSSFIAAGLMNPITGRRITPSWMADVIFPFAFETYRQAEAEYSTKFLHEMPVIRAFPSAEEKRLMLEALEQEEGRDFVQAIHDDFKRPGLLDFRFGGYELKNSGYLETDKFLTAVRKWLIEDGLLLQETIEYKDLDISEERVIWNGREARNIIFCEGYYNMHNPWFAYLPIHTLKGEMLNIYAPGLNLKNEIIAAQKLFIIPLGDNFFKVGATYQRDLTDSSPSRKGKQELIEKLEKLIDCGYEITGHFSGIRPATRDRRPIAGRHHKYSNMFVLNGLGTKGVTIGPYMADSLVRYILHGEKLPKEADIRRFDKFL